MIFHSVHKSKASLLCGFLCGGSDSLFFGSFFHKCDMGNSSLLYEPFDGSSDLLRLQRFCSRLHKCDDPEPVHESTSCVSSDENLIGQPCHTENTEKQLSSDLELNQFQF